MGKRGPKSAVDLKRARSMRRAGKSNREIGECFGVSESHIRKLLGDYGKRFKVKPQGSKPGPAPLHLIGKRFGIRLVTGVVRCQGQWHLVVRCDECGRQRLVYLANVLREKTNGCQSCSRVKLSNPEALAMLTEIDKKEEKGKNK